MNRLAFVIALIAIVGTAPAWATRGRDRHDARRARHCRIHRVTYHAGERNPANGCQECRPNANRRYWSDVAEGVACSDGNACTMDDSCAHGRCAGGPPADCDDLDICTKDTCDPASGCANTAVESGDVCATWVADGTVVTGAVAGETFFVGGDFDWIGPYSGGGIITEAATGRQTSGFPIVSGSVSAVVPDNRGGWFIGGGFDSVGGVPRSGLAHILADGSVDTWHPQPDGAVGTMALGGTTLFVAGEFGSIGGAPRQVLAAIDTRSGLATAWNPQPDGPVTSMALKHGVLYVAGAFFSIAGQARGCLAAFDARTGALTPWAIPEDRCAPSGIDSIAVGETLIYAAGRFNPNAPWGEGFLGFDLESGLVSDWSPNPTGNVAVVHTVVARGDTVYAGGQFTGIGGQPRNNLAALDATTGAARAWDPHPNGRVMALALGAGTVYASGGFTEIGGQQRDCAGAVDDTSGAATPWSAELHLRGGPLACSQRPLAFAAQRDSVFVGGPILGTTGGAERRSLAAIDVRSGRFKSFDAGASLWSTSTVGALAVRGDRVYVGGSSFASGSSLIGVNADTGAAAPWAPSWIGRVHSLAFDANTVFVATAGLGAFDATTAAATAFAPNLTFGGRPSQFVGRLAMGDDALFLSGTFDAIGGQPRQGLGAVDPVTGEARSWNPNVVGGIGPMLFHDGSLFVGGSFTSIGGESRQNLAALDPTTALPTTWNLPANGWVGGLAHVGETLFVRGSFTELGGESRNGLGALDLPTGNIESWNPTLHPPAFPGGLWPFEDRVFIDFDGDFSTCGIGPCSGVSLIRY